MPQITPTRGHIYHVCRSWAPCSEGTMFHKEEIVDISWWCINWCTGVNELLKWHCHHMRIVSTGICVDDFMSTYFYLLQAQWMLEKCWFTMECNGGYVCKHVWARPRACVCLHLLCVCFDFDGNILRGYLSISVYACWLETGWACMYGNLWKQYFVINGPISVEQMWELSLRHVSLCEWWWLTRLITTTHRTFIYC